MSFLKTFYKTKNLASNGVFILAATLVLFILGEYLIPEIKLKKVPGQIATLNGYNLKYNDSPEFEAFIRSIKENDGVLCLGTSESTFLGGRNYYHYLNNDPAIKKTRFSILAGAGRTCGMYIPLLLANKDVVDSLKIIYMINPVYWRNDLSVVSKEYWYRYSSFGMGREITIEEKDTFHFSPVDDYYKELNYFEKFVMSTEYLLRERRKKYFHDFHYTLKPEKFNDQFGVMSEQRGDLSQDLNFSNPDFSDLDTNWNILNSFHNHQWFDPINSSEDYRFKELKAFISLCKELNVDVTYVVCPYNERFISNYSPESLNGYKVVTEEIKVMLEQESATYVDATDISGKAGTFNDHQHYSSYGAFLIYKKLKDRFE